MNSVAFGNGNSGIQVGINTGSIYYPAGMLHEALFWPGYIDWEQVLGLERPETPPAPLSIIPFRRDPDFVDRGTLLDQIHEKGSVPGARIALTGLGGVGWVYNV